MVECVDSQLHVASSDEFSFVHQLATPLSRAGTEPHQGSEQENNVGLFCLCNEERSNVRCDSSERPTSQCPSKDRLALVGRSAIGATDLATGYFRAPIQYGPVCACCDELGVQVIEGGVRAPLADDLEGTLTVHESSQPRGLYWRQHRYQQYLSAEYLALAARRLQQQSLFADAP
jgi:hypothetical protein